MALELSVESLSVIRLNRLGPVRGQVRRECVPLKVANMAIN
ncbi:hypothetical protein KKC1_07820 [Calderihabitans maritimus]|uniref:Uncharacterized protein n=1 Tax=Calderihabitans maritimus TaxID=1246530 RepID=A0A1Z5HQN2_9FIRM|nr:hypothetical protein KKC1_07820 [Calderihabitans maritimus]